MIPPGVDLTSAANEGMVAGIPDQVTLVLHDTSDMESKLAQLADLMSRA
jgi:hypothetical protein